ncbi:hypothetical protein E4185_16745 [Aeromonas media]|uniref:hypothetical protein n=1 Tax=Aeromonas media TaxID=651 RepID=UPI00148B2BFA|nr:hypothetical protein [Aeromonas media]QJT27548.1 hypothetical protein E4185_16745 [Aeromonas media]
MNTKVNTITLTLSDKSITLTTHMVEDQQLYKAQDLITGYGYEGKQAQNTISHWLESMKSKILDFRVLSFRGKNGGTYLTEDQVYLLSMYIDTNFMLSVVAAFKALAHGNTKKAETITKGIVDVHNDIMNVNSKLPAIKRAYEKSDLGLVDFINDLIEKSSNNNKSNSKERRKFAKAMNNFVSGVEISRGSNFGSESVAILTAQLAISNYNSKTQSQAGNMKKTLALKSNRKLVRQSEALERMIDEAQAELEQVRTKARMIGSIALADRKMKNELELQIIDLEEHIEDLKAQREEIPF